MKKNYETQIQDLLEAVKTYKGEIKKGQEKVEESDKNFKNNEKEKNELNAKVDELKDMNKNLDEKLNRMIKINRD